MCLHTCTGRHRAGSKAGAAARGGAGTDAGLNSSLQTKTASAGYRGCDLTCSNQVTPGSAWGWHELSSATDTHLLSSGCAALHFCTPLTFRAWLMFAAERDQNCSPGGRSDMEALSGR